MKLQVVVTVKGLNVEHQFLTRSDWSLAASSSAFKIKCGGAGRPRRSAILEAGMPGSFRHKKHFGSSIFHLRDFLL